MVIRSGKTAAELRNTLQATLLPNKFASRFSQPIRCGKRQPEELVKCQVGVDFSVSGRKAGTEAPGGGHG